MPEPRNPLRGIDAPYDPYAERLAKQESLTKAPARLTARQAATLVSTIPQQRLRFRAHGPAQSIPNGASSNTIVTFDTVTTTFPVPHEFDTSDGRNTAGLLNSNGLKIPSTGMITGTWLIIGQVTWVENSAGFRELNIIVNGVAADVIARHQGAGQNEIQTHQVMTLVNDPPAGTTYKLMVNQNSGGPLDLEKGSADTFLMAVHLW